MMEIVGPYLLLLLNWNSDEEDPAVGPRDRLLLLDWYSGETLVVRWSGQCRNLFLLCSRRNTRLEAFGNASSSLHPTYSSSRIWNEVVWMSYIYLRTYLGPRRQRQVGTHPNHLERLSLDYCRSCYRRRYPNSSTTISLAGPTRIHSGFDRTGLSPKALRGIVGHFSQTTRNTPS